MVTCTQVLAHIDTHIHNFKKIQNPPPKKIILFKHFGGYVRFLGQPGKTQVSGGPRCGVWACIVLAPAPLWSSSPSASFCCHSFFPVFTCGSHLRNAYSQLLVEDIFMGTKSNFAVLFPTIFSCHFGLHFPLFLTEWNGNLSLFLVFKTDLFSAQLDLWSQEHKVVFFPFWRQTSCDGQIVRINYTKWGNKLEWKASLSLLVMHFFKKKIQ